VNVIRPERRAYFEREGFPSCSFGFEGTEKGISEMPISVQERAANSRKGGLIAADRMTPEQRRERSRKAHLAGAVNAIVKRAPELTAEQVSRLSAIFSGGMQ
jgi:hypothetical protein